MDIPRPKSKQQIPPDAKKVFTGQIFDVYQWEQEMYNGSTATFERLKRPDTVVVFPILEDGKILIIDEEQPGREPYVSSVGGRIDEGEDPITAIKRELLEETGYIADEYILWDAKHLTTKIDWVVYTFIAKGLKKITETNLDMGEKIILRPVDFEQFIDITSKENFVGIDILKIIYEAKLDPAKMAELKTLLSP